MTDANFGRHNGKLLDLGADADKVVGMGIDIQQYGVLSTSDGRRRFFNSADGKEIIVN